MAFKASVEWLGQLAHPLYHESTTAEEFIVNNIRYGTPIGDDTEIVTRGNIIFNSSPVWNDSASRNRILKYVEPGIIESVDFNEDLQLLTAVQVYDSEGDFQLYEQMLKETDFEFAETQDVYVQLIDKVILETYEE